MDDECSATGTCVSCSTFNQADVDHIKSLGWNSIRLGVVWAGAQPADVDELDADFVARLHAVLNLTDTNGRVGSFLLAPPASVRRATSSREPPSRPIRNAHRTTTTIPEARDLARQPVSEEPAENERARALFFFLPAGCTSF